MTVPRRLLAMLVLAAMTILVLEAQQASAGGGGTTGGEVLGKRRAGVHSDRSSIPVTPPGPPGGP